MIVTDNPRADRPVMVPTRDDGTRYRYEMIFDSHGARAYADTLAELIPALIPGYDTIATAQEADVARLLFAVRTQVELQAYLVAAGDVEAATPDERATLLATRDTPPEVTNWACDIPLVLVATYYAPVGSLPRPTGLSDPKTDAVDTNIVWLDPVDEVSFVESLDRAGVVVLAELEPAPQ